jgi:hypothetical protein
MKAVMFIVGLLITFGAVGTMDHDPDANVYIQTVLALAGILIMGIAVRGIQEQ